jgi:hypothetical protein
VYNPAPAATDLQRMHAQASRIEALHGGLAPGARHGYGWQDMGMLLESVDTTELFTFSSTPKSFGETYITMRASKVAELQRAAAAAAPRTASEALDRMSSATAAADAVHAQVEAQQHKELQAEV